MNSGQLSDDLMADLMTDTGSDAMSQDQGMARDLFYDAPIPAVVMHVMEVYLLPAEPSKYPWHCAGLALLLVLIVLAVLTLIILFIRWCCRRKPAVAVAELGPNPRFVASAVTNSEKHVMEQMDPGLMEMYTKPDRWEYGAS